MRETFTRTLRDEGMLELQTYAEKGGVKIGTPAFSALVFHGQLKSITEIWFVDSAHEAVTRLPKRIREATLFSEVNGQFDLYKHDNKQDVLFTAPSGQYYVYVSKHDDAFVAFVKA